MPSTFIGIDLAWQTDKNHSGIMVMEGDKTGAEIISFSKGITNLEAVFNFIKSYKTSNTIIAIDAPLIIKNQTGQRPCEKLIGKKFGSRHASAHSTNLDRYPDAGSVKLANLLEKEGFIHNPSEDFFKKSSWFFEVYPHPAQIILFNLNNIIKYKNVRRVDEKRNGLRILRNYIKEKMLKGNPSIRQNDKLHGILNLDLQTFIGKDLKQYEDVIDALICAYLALFYWAWGTDKNEMIGDLETGYIINPTHPL